MRILLAVIGMGLLAGCASMNEKRQAGAANTYASAKPFEEVAECVLFAWQNQSLAGAHPGASIQPLAGGGKTVLSAGEVEFADFSQTAGGTRVDLYFQTGLMDWRKNRRIGAVKSCL